MAGGTKFEPSAEWELREAKTKRRPHGARERPHLFSGACNLIDIRQRVWAGFSALMEYRGPSPRMQSRTLEAHPPQSGGLFGMDVTGGLFGMSGSFVWGWGVEICYVRITRTVGKAYVAG